MRIFTVVFCLLIIFLTGCGGGGQAKPDQPARPDSIPDTGQSTTDAGVTDTGFSGDGGADPGEIPADPGKQQDGGTTDAYSDPGANPDTGSMPDPGLASMGPNGDREPGSIVVMTFNVLCSFCNAKDFDPWEDRLPDFADIFARHDPDLIGLQELSVATEVEQVLTRSPKYDAIFFSGKLQGRPFDYPDATILYRKALFEVVESGSYWLSPTPDVPFSIGFAPPQIFRLVIWAHLRRKTDGLEFFFATTHFDNNSPSQVMSAPLLLERTTPWAGRFPVIVTGDFNSNPTSQAYKLLVGSAGTGFHFADAFEMAGRQTVEASQDPPPTYDPTIRIDHVFLAGADWKVPRWAVDLNVFGPLDRFPSDHFAISARLLLP